MFRRFLAHKVTVEADDIDNVSKKYHETKTHNASSYVADGDVRITIEQQYINTKENIDRPDVKTVHTGDRAIFSARKKHYIVPSEKDHNRKKGAFSGNVHVNLESKDSDHKKKRVDSKEGSSKKKGGRRV